MFKVRTYNRIAVRGLDRFDRASFEVGSDIGHPDAFLIRSQALHDIEFPDTLLAIARAGAGVNNVPIARCSAAGVVVFNTPGANANAVKELVVAGMLLSARGILPGIAWVGGLAGTTDAAAMSATIEKEKARFAGTELKGRTLGIVGLGAIGSMVADVALALGMKVLGFDPALSVDAAWRLSNAVTRMENLQALLARSDLVTLHVPAIEATRHLVDDEALRLMKPGAVLLNFARESIVDAAAVRRALDAGRLGRYVCDFPEPGLVEHPKVIAMPHIGASTEESEENCAVMAADQLVDYLRTGDVTNAVNFPAVRLERAPGTTRLVVLNDNVAGVLGHVLSVLADRTVNVVDMVNKSRGELGINLIDVESAIGDAVVAAIRAVPHVIRVRVLAPVEGG
ncbi:MAG: phosphoglycerate dehydrogenase [Burkholderiaceae bacterium]|jgi:D-3-phosphoglycerate dehydrogenase|nr:phosphoglycerate dehydrogenase [Burkholderiales bacterium]MCZ8338326.1 phosphoglycerate dehydrogenase [Burkholderiaceae bacterium]